MSQEEEFQGFRCAGCDAPLPPDECSQYCSRRCFGQLFPVVPPTEDSSKNWPQLLKGLPEDQEGRGWLTLTE